MEQPTKYDLEALIGADKLEIRNGIIERIEQLYDMYRLWNKGFGDWTYEYKYRRGGKTLCTFYAKPNTANLLIILGKAEREKFEAERENYTEQILALYDATKSLHDGKWLRIPIDDLFPFDDILNILRIKRKPNRK